MITIPPFNTPEHWLAHKMKEEWLVERLPREIAPLMRVFRCAKCNDDVATIGIEGGELVRPERKICPDCGTEAKP